MTERHAAFFYFFLFLFGRGKENLTDRAISRFFFFYFFLFFFFFIFFLKKKKKKKKKSLALNSNWPTIIGRVRVSFGPLRNVRCCSFIYSCFSLYLIHSKNWPWNLLLDRSDGRATICPLEDSTDWKRSISRVEFGSQQFICCRPKDLNYYYLNQLLLTHCFA